LINPLLIRKRGPAARSLKEGERSLCAPVGFANLNPGKGENAPRERKHARGKR